MGGRSQGVDALEGVKVEDEGCRHQQRGRGGWEARREDEVDKREDEEGKGGVQALVGGEEMS